MPDCPPPDELIGRLSSLEHELRDARREIAELRAAHDDAIDLALSGAVPNSIFRLIASAREHGWTLVYSRSASSEAYGTIQLGHPTAAVHDCSIDLPLPDDPAARRQIETDIGMRIRWTQAA
jgi:hypothetical protein